MMATETAKPPLVDRLRVQRERHHRRPMVVRVLYVIAGFAVLAFGLLTLITPGPAFVIIPIGLAMLSLEFQWAEGLLGKAVKKGEQAKAKAAQTTTTQRVLTGVVVALAIASVVVWAIYGDIPLVPV